MVLMVLLTPLNGVSVYAVPDMDMSDTTPQEETAEASGNDDLSMLGKPRFTLKSYGKGQVVLSCKQVSDATGFDVYYKNGKNKKWVHAGRIDNLTRKYYFKGLKKNKTYYFKFISYKTDADGRNITGNPVEKSVKVIYKSVKMKQGDYKSGSVYGPSLTTAELNQVKAQVQKFLDENIVESMSDYEKAAIAHDYLVENCGYAESWAKNRANSAWGALVYHEAQCSGYARAYKALCDAMGIGCYYVHANEESINPSHQFNIVQIDKAWYIVDVQLNDSSGFDAAFFCSAKEYKELGIRWDESKFPKCKSNYVKEHE